MSVPKKDADSYAAHRRNWRWYVIERRAGKLLAWWSEHDSKADALEALDLRRRSRSAAERDCLSVWFSRSGKPPEA